MRTVSKVIAVSVCALLAGCQDPLLTCNDPAVTDLVMQLVKDNADYRSRFQDTAAETRAKGLADEALSVETTLTRKAATAENPTASCEAKVRVAFFEVGRNQSQLLLEEVKTAALPVSPRERTRTARVDPGATNEEREASQADRMQANEDYDRALADAREAAAAIRQRNQQRQKEFNTDPNTITRLGLRKEVELAVSYTAGVTDDGRAVVRIEQ
jgi:hypothetical protein